MGRESSIEWTDATWNPVRGCSRVSKGCENCYAEGVARRFSGPGQPYEGLVRLDREGRAKAQWNGVVRMVPEHLADPFLDALQPVDVVTWRDAIAKVSAPATTNSHLRVLREILADAAAELQLPNPAARVRQVAELSRADGKALSADELGRVLVAMRELDLPARQAESAGGTGAEGRVARGTRSARIGRATRGARQHFDARRRGAQARFGRRGTPRFASWPDEVQAVSHDMAWHGRAGIGLAGHGEARLGKARALVSIHGQANSGSFPLRGFRNGSAGPGAPGHGMARQGF